jgi:hypothetical protein
MADSPSDNERFRCACCERHLAGSRASSARLVNNFGQYERICSSCEYFLDSGLPFLQTKLKAKNLRLLKPDPNIPASTLKRPPDAPKRPASDKPKQKQRLASATEYEAFYYNALSVKRFIDGFIQGLETGGVERSRLTKTAEGAINNLLGIRQDLSFHRPDVTGRTRAEVRRMRRHIKETALIVEEYVRAVIEERAAADRSKAK